MAFDPAAWATDIRNDLTTAMDDASSVWNRLKTLGEEKLPAIEKAGSAVGNDRLFQQAMDDTIPAPLRALGAEVIDKGMALLGSAVAAPAEAVAPAGDVSTDVPAQPAQPAA